MPEQVPVADGRYEPRDFVLDHRPERKTYGLRNLLTRKQAYRWRARIAYALLDEPGRLVCWRWENRPWPQVWQDIRQHPLRTTFRRLTRGTLAGLRDQWRLEKHLFPSAAISGPINHALIAFAYWRFRRLNVRGKLGAAQSCDLND